MAKGIKTGGGSRRGCPNKRQRLHFDQIAEKVTDTIDLAGVFCALLQAPDSETQIDALKIFCEYAFMKPKQQVEHSGVEFGVGNLIPYEQRDPATIN